MKNKIVFTVLAFVLVFSLALTGCKNNSNGKTASTDTTVSDVSLTYDETDNYIDWKQKEYTTLDLSKGTMEITKSGIYVAQGELTDGSITVNVDKKSDSGIVYLVLNGATLNSTTTAPINITEAKKVVLIIENGTTNTVTQGSNIKVDESENPSAAIFSKADLTITGSGTLNVKTEYNDGITSKDTLKITDGNINVTANKDGIVGKDFLGVKAGTISVTSEHDGLKSSNDTEADKGYIIIDGGTFDIKAGTQDFSSKTNTDMTAGATPPQNDDKNNSTTTQSTSNVDTIASATTGNKDKGDSNNGNRPTMPNQNGNSGDNSNGTPPQMPNGQAPSGDKPDFGGGFGGGNKGGMQEGNSQKSTESMKALKGYHGVFINAGTFILSSYDDAIHSNGVVKINNGTITIKTADDGIHADGNLEINSGEITITTSYEGLEGTNITLNGGKIDVTASDDGVNVNADNGTLTITNGEMYINASGDGLDSNGTIKMTGGTVYVDGPTNDGNGALDYNSSFEMNGGTLVAAGSSGMAQTTSSGTQNSIIMCFTSSQKAETKITLKDSKGNEIISYSPKKQFNSIVLSSKDLKTNETYTLYSGDTKVVEFKPTDAITYVDENGITQAKGGMQGGGFKGGQKPGDNQNSNTSSQSN